MLLAGLRVQETSSSVGRDAELTAPGEAGLEGASLALGNQLLQAPTRALPLAHSRTGTLTVKRKGTYSPSGSFTVVAAKSMPSCSCDRGGQHAELHRSARACQSLLEGDGVCIQRALDEGQGVSLAGGELGGGKLLRVCDRLSMSKSLAPPARSAGLNNPSLPLSVSNSTAKDFGSKQTFTRREPAYLSHQKSKSEIETTEPVGPPGMPGLLPQAPQSRWTPRWGSGWRDRCPSPARR